MPDRRTAQEALQRLTVDVADWPEKGVTFKDITPVLADHHAFSAIITALERLGEDVSSCFDQATLVREAEAGLAKPRPKGLDWLPVDRLPALRWQDGTPVDQPDDRLVDQPDDQPAEYPVEPADAG